MKKSLISLFSALIFSITAFAQAPQSFKYQAVVRDVAGHIIPNQSVGFQISILQGSASGTSVYTETHIVQTNDLGLTSLDIGHGSIISGVFNQVSWDIDNFFVNAVLVLWAG